jgi:MFS family permease
VNHSIKKLAPYIATMARISIPRWRVFGAACLAHVLHDGCSSMLYLLLPFWQTELALSLTEVGILKTVYSAAMAIGQVPAGRLGERWSERLPLVAGTFLTAAAVFALHWAATPLVLGLLLSIGGLGASVQHPLASTLISKVYGGSALRVKLGTYNFAGDLGKMLIPAVLTILIAAFGWRGGTMSIGVLGLATAAILLIALPPRAHDPTQKDGIKLLVGYRWPSLCDGGVLPSSQWWECWTARPGPVSSRFCRLYWLERERTPPSSALP